MKFPDLLTTEHGEMLFILRCRINHCHEMIDMAASEVAGAYWQQQLEIALMLHDKFGG